MTPQLLIPFSPFLGVVFLFFALIQAIRHKQQGGGTAFLALLAIGVPVAAFVVTTDANVKAALVNFMAINAAIVFIGSIVILLIERGNPTRDMSHSYGMLGIGVAIVLALGIFITPMIARAGGILGGDTTGAAGAQTATQGNAQVVQALTQQTGLTAADLSTQLTSGSTTIAQLVTAHNGNLATVTSAISTALDQMIASGAQGAQFFSRIGTSSDIATQLVQGQLQSRVQTLMIGLLLGSGTGTGTGGFGGNGTGNFGGNGGGNNPQATQEANPQGNGGFGGFGGNSTPNAPQGNGGFGGNNPQATQEANSQGNGGNFGGFGGNNPQATQEANSQGNGSFGGFGGAPNATATPAPSEVSEPLLAPTNTPDNLAAPQATTATETQVAQVLTQQTGLSLADLTTQLSSGSTTIAQLVTAHNGDLSAVTSAITTALDQFTAAGGAGAQLLSRLGSSSADIATSVVQGQLQGRAQTTIVNVLLTGTLPTFGGFGGNGTGGTGGNGGNGSGGNGGGAAQVPPTATETPAPPTATVMRPTPIVFPTDTPTPEGTEQASAASTAEATGEASSTNSTSSCTLVTVYNLNLRDKPSKDNGVVLLSIPLNTTLTPTSKTSDGWYSVSYSGHDGWIDSQFTVQRGDCSTVPAGS